LILTVAAGVACPIMFFHMRNFVKALDDAIKLNSEQRILLSDSDSMPTSPLAPLPKRQSKSKPVNDNQSSGRDKLAGLRSKVMALMITSTLSSSLVVVVCLVCGIFQFVSRTVPLSWVVYYAITIAIGLFALQLAHSAKKTKAESQSHRSAALGHAPESDILSKSQGTT
jgi:hypothetical protein